MKKRIIILTSDACYLAKSDGEIVTLIVQNFFDDSISINAYSINSQAGRMYTNFNIWLQSFAPLSALNPVLFSKEIIERKEVDNDGN
jgi:hypothetical protein